MDDWDDEDVVMEIGNFLNPLPLSRRGIRRNRRNLGNSGNSLTVEIGAIVWYSCCINDQQVPEQAKNQRLREHSFIVLHK